MVCGWIKGAGVPGSLFLPRKSLGTRLIQMYMERNVDMCIVHVVLRAFPAYSCVIEYCNHHVDGGLYLWSNRHI